MATKKIKQSVEVGDGIYLLDKSKDIVKSKKENLVFTVLGSHDKLDNGNPILTRDDAINHDLAYAKQVVSNNTQTFYIKIDDQGQFFNPMSAAPNTSDHKYKMMKDDKSKAWQFVKVSEDCFNHYINMLRTRNVLHLKVAERLR